MFNNEDLILDEDLICEEVDGGREDFSTQAKTRIESQDIVKFEICFSLEPFEDSTKIDVGLYTLKAVLSDNKVMLVYDFINRMKDYTLKKTIKNSFLKKLQNIVSENDFAKFNGKSFYTSGLPDMYGCECSIIYLSDETIYFSNNDESFLNLNQLEEVESLFRNEFKKELKNPDKYSIKETPKDETEIELEDLDIDDDDI